jgi:hypothetical protein
MNSPKTYIQRRGQGHLETVDEFDTYKEARAMLAEYRLADPSAYYYLSSRCCAAWRLI